MNDDNAYNYVFVNVLKDKSSLDEMNSIWDPSETFPNTNMSKMETWSMSNVVHSVLAYTLGSAGQGGQYARVNYCQVSDMSDYQKLELDTWQPFITKAIKDEKTSVVGWNMGTVVMPRGEAMPFNAFTIDHFDTFSEAVWTSWADDLEFPVTETFSESFERTEIQIYRLVKRVN